MFLDRLPPKAAEICANCPYKERIVPPLEPLQPGGFIVVGECPGRNEWEQKEPFVGETGQILQSTTKAIQLPRSLQRITNACLCYNVVPPDYCADRLKAELEYYPEKYVLLLGDAALSSALGHSGIMKMRGYIHEKDNKTYLPTVHPAMILPHRSPESSPLFFSDLVKFGNLFRGQLETVNKVGYAVADTEEKLLAATRWLCEHEWCWDIESTGTDCRKDSMICIGFYPSWQDRVACIIPLQYEGQWLLPESIVMACLNKIFTSSVEKSSHTRFDIQMMHSSNIDVKNFFMDTAHAHHLLYEDLPKGLGCLGSFYCSVPEWKSELTNYFKKKKLAPLDVYYRRVAWDVNVTWMCKLAITDRLKKADLWNYYINEVKPLIPCASHIEREGMLASKEQLKEVAKENQIKTEKLQNSLFEQVGHVFNYRSHPQLVKVLFEDLNLPIQGLTDSKKPTPKTDKKVLKRLTKFHNVPDVLLKIRKLEKLKTTYLDGRSGEAGMFRWINQDGLVFSEFNLDTTPTARWASRRPNLQNIPRTGGIRSFFIAPPGFKFLSVDYSQAELRVLAYLSRCKKLIKQLSYEDVHKQIASELFGIPPEQVTKLQRVIAKGVVFGLIYGRGAASISEQIGITEDEAKQWISKFFQLYEEVADWRKNVFDDVYTKRTIRNVYGLRRAWPKFCEVQHQWLRQAVNFHCQSTVACAMNRAIRGIVPRFLELGLASRVVSQVHDELLLYRKMEEEQVVHQILHEEMEKPIPVINCVLPIDFEVSDYWLDKE